jgi:threonine aldolase
VGSLICGGADFITQAHRIRKMLGGGMRQSGILAAAGLYTLDHHTDRLSEDHANAVLLARGLAGARGVSVLGKPETNIVLFDVAGAADFVRAARERSVLVSAVGGDTIRAVTHLDVSRAEVEKAVETFASLASPL